jgi:hypothetical protein
VSLAIFAMFLVSINEHCLEEKMMISAKFVFTKKKKNPNVMIILPISLF